MPQTACIKDFAGWIFAFFPHGATCFLCKKVKRLLAYLINVDYLCWGEWQIVAVPEKRIQDYGT